MARPVLCVLASDPLPAHFDSGPDQLGRQAVPALCASGDTGCGEDPGTGTDVANAGPAAEEADCVLFGTRGGAVVLWDVRQPGSSARRVAQLGASCLSLQRLAGGSRLWLVGDAGLRLELRDPRMWAQALGPTYAFAGYDNTVMKSQLGALASPSGRAVAACTRGGGVRLWSDRGRLLADSELLPLDARCLCFLPPATRPHSAAGGLADHAIGGRLLVGGPQGLALLSGQSGAWQGEADGHN